MNMDPGEAKRSVEATSRKEALWRELETHSGLGAWVTYVILFSILLAYPLLLGGRTSQWGAYSMLVMCFSVLFMLLHRKLNSVIALMKELDRR